MTEKRLRVGVVGLGVGEQHLLAYAADPRCDVVALCDLDESRAIAAARRTPGARPTADPSAVLDDPAIGAVSIASYDDAHAAQTLAALRAGKHVLVEKPLCRTEEELSAIAAAHQRQPDLALASNLVLRAAPAFRWLRGACATGELGTVYAFDGDYLYGRLGKITHGWRGGIPDYSVMLGGGVHLVDLMLWCLGERPVSVTAVGADLATRGSAFSGADFVAATFTFSSGAVGRITANFGCVHRHQHVVRVFGTAASFVSDDRGARVSTRRDPAPARDLTVAQLPPSKGALVTGFVDAALNIAPLEPDVSHELAVVAACLAADRSMRTGERVEIVYP